MVLSDHEAHSVEVADIAELSVAILEVAGVCSDEGPDNYWEGGSVFALDARAAAAWRSRLDLLAIGVGSWVGLLCLGLPALARRGMSVILAEGVKVLVCRRGLFWGC